MLQFTNYLLYFLIYFFLAFNTAKVSAQAVGCKTQIHYSPITLSEFSSSITIDENHLFFIANDYHLYCFDKNNFELKYKKELNSKTNTPPYLFKDTLITSISENQKRYAIILNKNTGEIFKKLNISPLKSKPYFINDSTFISTIIDDDGGQLVCYDLKSDTVLWKHFIGHGADKPFYIQDESVLANFDYNEWKIVSYDGTIHEEIVEEYETNNKYKRHSLFFDLAHDKNEIKEDFLNNYFSNTENIKTKTNENITVLLNPKKLLIFEDDLKVKTNNDLIKGIQLPDEGENDYLEILKIENQNVWLFYQNVIVNYDFSKNKVIKTYDLTKWNTYQAILEENTLWLISKNDGQLYGLQLEITQKQLDEKKARMKHLECIQPDKARIEAQKTAEEKMKRTTKNK